MRSSHTAGAVDVVFDEPNLITDAGLVPVLALAEQIGLPDLVTEHVAITDAANSAGANPAAKVLSLLAGMVAGADSIEDTDRLRAAGNQGVFAGIRAPSTLGTFLRAFTHGHVQQLNAVLRHTVIALAQRVPLLPGSDEVVFVDLDSTHRQVYGYAKQGAAVGRLKGRKTLHPLIATASTPIARPVMVAIRLRQGKSADVRGAARFLGEALTTVRAITPTARIVVRADSKFYTADIAATAARYSADVSLTTGTNPSITAAIGQIPEGAWTAIHYPNAFVDTETGQLVSDAEVAPIPYTAFTSHPKRQQVAGRLTVRRIKRLNSKALAGQQGLFDVWRYHAVFVTNPFPMLQAEGFHRDHAVIEQVISDAAASALAHLPSGSFCANAAWAVLWAIAHNLTRAAGCLAGSFHARATTATIRAHLISVPARLARSARRLILHLPESWPWQPVSARVVGEQYVPVVHVLQFGDAVAVQQGVPAAPEDVGIIRLDTVIGQQFLEPCSDRLGRPGQRVQNDHAQAHADPRVVARASASVLVSPVRGTHVPQSQLQWQVSVAVRWQCAIDSRQRGPALVGQGGHRMRIAEVILILAEKHLAFRMRWLWIDVVQISDHVRLSWERPELHPVCRCQDSRSARIRAPSRCPIATGSCAAYCRASHPSSAMDSSSAISSAEMPVMANCRMVQCVDRYSSLGKARMFRDSMVVSVERHQLASHSAPASSRNW